jgi:hypothetical protein
MTEQDWLAGTDPNPMLEYLWGKVTDRKFRLFRCACCRRFEVELSGDPVLRKAVELGESYADGSITGEEFEAGREDCLAQSGIGTLVLGGRPEHHFGKSVLFAVWPRAGVDPLQVNRMACGRLGWTRVTPWSEFAGQQETATKLLQAESIAQCSLLREIFGNPFRPVTVDLVWQTANVVNLAQAIYDDRAFDRLPILADALEDAGCSDADILAHCRDGGEHVRGCWVVDLLTGRE